MEPSMLSGYRVTHHAWSQCVARDISWDAVTLALHTPPIGQTATRAYHVWASPARRRVLVVCVAYHPRRILSCFWRNARDPLTVPR